jgi:hypothetical protein
MDYYGDVYTSEEHTYISIVEGVYDVRDVPTSRVIGCINLTDNTMIKYVKQPYIVINKIDTELILTHRNFIMETNTLNYQKSYVILDTLLLNYGMIPAEIQLLKQKIREISENRGIKTQSSALGEWVSL